ncbi:MAG: hypothetical protein Unbinned6284contig1004_22 [Prokaryotic dsDNA virus sp.]|nr:MAG: hypothetical protein Unbinned6284contig1004_22 [Prokaryotic dsDNA virus sp.]|tara:strand:- start:30561 stop:30779 length:219 start_codon:yes stop_codon:yes gene_type:complete
MTETQIKKEVLKIIGQEDLKDYFDYSNAETRERIIDSIFDVLCITEDDIEEDCDNTSQSELVEDEYARAKGF